MEKCLDWGYLSEFISFAGECLALSECKYRRALGFLLARVAPAVERVGWDIEDGDSSSKCAIKAIRKAMWKVIPSTSGKNVAEWHSVDEQLPEDNEWVLFLQMNHYLDGKPRVDVGFVVRGPDGRANWYEVCDEPLAFTAFVDRLDVTHWMRFPTPEVACINGGGRAIPE